jgi:hypothetical protein
MRTDWKSRPHNVKAQIGEAVADRMLIARQFMPYGPVFDGPHPFDRVAIHRNTLRPCCVEVKTKPCRNNHPDSGFNESQYKVYKTFEYRTGIPVYVVFVDERRKQIYGNWLSALEKPYQGARFEYPSRYCDKHGTEIIYFPLARMEILGTLEDDCASQLAALRRSDHDIPQYELDFGKPPMIPDPPVPYMPPPE